MFSKDGSKELRRFGYVKDGENYVKLKNGAMSDLIGPEVAIAYEISMTPEGKPNFESVVMHKHGKPEDVEDWAKTAREKMSAVWPDIHFEVIRGAIPLSELNGILDSCARLGVFLKQLHEAAEQVRQDHALAPEVAAAPPLGFQCGVGSAFQISEEDLANVIASNTLSRERIGASPEELAALLFPQLDMEAIENMALMGDDLDQQTDYAHDEIADQLRRMGILESDDSAGHLLADSAACIGYERERVRP